MNPRILRTLLLTTPFLLVPTPLHAQIPIISDLGAVAQRAVIIAQQLTQIGHQATSIATLRDQFDELENQLEHMRNEALGQVGPLGDAFSALSAADAQTLLNTGFGSWQNRLSETSRNLAGALASLDGSSLSDFLVDELDAADAIGDADLRALFPNTHLAGAMADDWAAARARGDRIRAGDLATAEAAGRVTALLRDAQVDIDGRRGQATLSHTALQQAQIANQLTAAEMQVALAQLQALQAQQQALQRHEAELLHRASLERWVASERAAQDRAATYRAALDGKRAEWRAALRLLRP